MAFVDAFAVLVTMFMSACVSVPPPQWTILFTSVYMHVVGAQ